MGTEGVDFEVLARGDEEKEGVEGVGGGADACGKKIRSRDWVWVTTEGPTSVKEFLFLEPS